MASSQCCEHPPTLNPASGQGCVVDDLGGLKAYTVGPPACKTAILLLSDVFGYEAPNLRKLADKVAAAGFFVVVPDFFHGDPYVPDQKPINVWLESHGTDKGFEDAKLVIEALKNKGVSIIGAAGFCWGAKVVAELAKCDYIKAAVLLHPALVTVDDIKEVKCSIAILGAEFDEVAPPELLKQFEEILSLKSEVNGHVKVFPGAGHGWTTRYDTSDEMAVKKAEESHQDMLESFAKNLN
ncbi:endo-1,3;1,4-beta-D-glucanase isoform X2 [Elaeis guineensis]|uniref:endo-1,3;1,4-beta-D-glucanase isoform X2 n=1 Tax=Elaeis guineensis var. tenera TaxID=51953 RepID=UPI003C6DA88A